MSNSNVRKPSGSSRRWVLVTDEQSVRRLLWEWEPWADDDIDELFARVADGVATDVDHELFDASMLDRFICKVHAGEPVEAWILKALANAFMKVLMGGEWDDEIRLPGRPVRPIRSPKDQRDLEVYCAVINAIRGDGLAVVKAIEAAAKSRSISYETARAGYYRWANCFSKNDKNSQKDI